MRPVLLLLLALCAAAVLGESTLSRVYRKDTDFVGTCTVTRLNDLGHTALLDLDFHLQSGLGNQYYVVRNDGNIIRRGLYNNNCPVFNIGEFSDGWLYTSTSRCDCEDAETSVCELGLEVNQEGVAGPVAHVGFGEANWSPQVADLQVPFDGAVVVGVTADGSTTGCAPLTNDVAGRIVMVDRGVCAFQDKFDNAENAGAVALIVANGEGAQLIDMSIQESNIPGIIIDFDSAQFIRTQPGVTVRLGPGVGPVGTGVEQEPAGLTHIAFRDIDDDTDAVSWANTFKFVKSGAFLDHTRNYLHVIGPDGEAAVRVYDLRPGISTPRVVGDLPFFQFRDYDELQFFTREGRTLMAGVDALSDHFSVWDVHDIHDPQLVDFVETGFPQVYDKVDTDRLEGEYFFVENRPLGSGNPPSVFVVHMNFEGELNIDNEIQPPITDADGAISFIKVNENVLYIGLGSFGFAAYEISDPKNPRHLATKRTFDGEAGLPFAAGALSACIVPDDPTLIYIGNADERGRDEVLGYKLDIQPPTVEVVVPETSFTPMDTPEVPAVIGLTPDTVAQSSNYFGRSGDTDSTSDLNGDNTSTTEAYGDDDDDDDDDFATLIVGTGSDGTSSSSSSSPSHVFIVNVVKTPLSHILGGNPSAPTPPSPHLPTIQRSSSFSSGAWLLPTMVSVAIAAAVAVLC